MGDKTIQTALLVLLRLGLWGKQDEENLTALSEVQWNQLFRAAQAQTIDGIVFDGIHLLPSALVPPRKLLLKWTVRIDQIERQNQRMSALMNEQLVFLKAHNIHPILLKGHGVAACYDHPNHRVSGDVDWYFNHKEDYQKANELVEKKGVKVIHSAGFSSNYLWRGIVIEHHQRMFDIHNPFNYRYLNRLQKQYQSQAIQIDLKETTLYAPAPLLMMIQVNVHILKHLLSFGIGIRQFCDAARVYYTYRAEIDGQELKECYKKLGILKWIHLLHAVLVKYIGLADAYLPFEVPEDIDADWMMQEVLEVGNFGFHRDSEFATEEDLRSLNVPLRNLKRYFSYAPMEVISFPLFQIFSKFYEK